MLMREICRLCAFEESSSQSAQVGAPCFGPTVDVVFAYAKVSIAHGPETQPTTQ